MRRNGRNKKKRWRSVDLQKSLRQTTYFGHEGKSSCSGLSCVAVIAASRSAQGNARARDLPECRRKVLFVCLFVFPPRSQRDANRVGPAGVNPPCFMHACAFCARFYWVCPVRGRHVLGNSTSCKFHLFVPVLNIYSASLILRCGASFSICDEPQFLFRVPRSHARC